MVDPAVLVDAARSGRVGELHDQLVLATLDFDEAPRDLLQLVTTYLPRGDTNLPPRAAVAMRLLHAGAYDAAWAVILDNAVGVVEQTLRTSTSSGARRTAEPLPLATLVEPPEAYAWLPGFRDPRYKAPDAAYRITDSVTASVRLDEAWWDGTVLVLAGLASMRHLVASADDDMTIVLRRDEQHQVSIGAQRVRRPDLVRGSGAELTRAAWSGFVGRIDTASLARGLWSVRLRLSQQGVTREVRLGRTRLDAVAASAVTRAGGRAEVRVGDAGTTVVVGSPLLARSPRDVLHAVARRARGR